MALVAHPGSEARGEDEERLAVRQVDGDRFTSGGASPTLDMMLDLIRLRQGYGLALIPLEVGEKA